MKLLMDLILMACQFDVLMASHKWYMHLRLFSLELLLWMLVSLWLSHGKPLRHLLLVNVHWGSLNFNLRVVYYEIVDVVISIRGDEDSWALSCAFNISGDVLGLLRLT